MTGQHTEHGARPILRPTLLLDRLRAAGNIAGMAARARASGVRLRPHFKTHQSAEVGEWFRPHGVDAICVSSMKMAAFFAEHGWSDILVAFPVNLREIELINSLAERLRLGLLIDSEEAIAGLEKRLQHRIALWIKIDVGYGRAGVPWMETDRILHLAKQATRVPLLEGAGVLTHSGHSYRATSVAAIRRLHAEAIERMDAVREALAARGLPFQTISIGDTPTCSLAEDFRGVDEVRPGNFVFHDVMQLGLGSCAPEQIAVAVACPVVAKYAARNQLLIHGGAVHLSKEHLQDKHLGRIFGLLTQPDDESLGRILPDAAVVLLSQEHGLVQLGRRHMERFQVADLVHVLPVHSCLAANQFDEYRLLDGVTIPRMRS